LFLLGLRTGMRHGLRKPEVLVFACQRASNITVAYFRFHTWYQFFSLLLSYDE